jgi:hypothetical protein
VDALVTDFEKIALENELDMPTLKGWMKLFPLVP